MCLAACMLSCLIVSGQKLKLSVPKVNHSLVMLSGSPVALEFDFRMEAAEIRYTKDGTDPIPTSLLYKNTLKVLKPGTIKDRKSTV